MPKEYPLWVNSKLVIINSLVSVGANVRLAMKWLSLIRHAYTVYDSLRYRSSTLTSADLLSIGPGTNFSGISIKVLNFDFTKIHLQMSSAKCRSFCSGFNVLTHWSWVTHICACKLIIIGSDNGLSPGRRQAIMWTNPGILLIQTLETNFSEIWSKIHPFWFYKMHLKMSSAKWW